MPLSGNALDLGVSQVVVLVPSLPLMSHVILEGLFGPWSPYFFPYRTGVTTFLQGYCKDYRYCVYYLLNSAWPPKNPHDKWQLLLIIMRILIMDGKVLSKLQNPTQI